MIIGNLFLEREGNFFSVNRKHYYMLVNKFFHNFAPAENIEIAKYPHGLFIYLFSKW
jgi:hypothetical protein